MKRRKKNELLYSRGILDLTQRHYSITELYINVYLVNHFSHVKLYDNKYTNESNISNLFPLPLPLPPLNTHKKTN